MLAILFLTLLIQSHAPHVHIQPNRPVQGTLFTITVKDKLETLSGTFAGQPVYFDFIPGGRRAAAAVPVDAGSSLTLELKDDSSAESWRIPAPIAKGSYRTQRVPVATDYGREPDAAANPSIDRAP